MIEGRKREKKAQGKTRSAVVSQSSDDSSEEEDLEDFVEGMRTTNMLFVTYAKAGNVRDIILIEVQLEKYGIKV